MGLARWLCGLALVMCNYALAGLPETPQFRTLGVADGLPSSAIHAITQDHEGYVWFASNDGLARFDGVGFKVYQHAPGDANSLPGNAVLAVFNAPDDALWMAIEGHGVARLDKSRQTFIFFSGQNGHEFFSDDVWAITATPDGALWFGSFGGGLVRRDKYGKFTAFRFNKNDANSLPADNVLALAVDERGDLWAGTTSGIARFNGQNFERFPADQLSAPVVFSVSAEAGGRVWIGTANGLDVREADGRIAPVTWRDQLSERGVTGVFLDKHGTRWISTRRGLNRERDGHVQAYSSGPAAIALNGVFEDHQGGLWFASPDRGVLRLPADWRHFSVLTQASKTSPGIYNSAPRGMANAGADDVWLVGSPGVLERLNLSSGEAQIEVPADTFPDARLSAVLQRRDGSVWVGHQRGLTRIDPTTKVAQHWLSDSPSDAALPGPIVLLCEDGDGLLWSLSLGYGLQARDAFGAVKFTVNSADSHAALRDPEHCMLGPDGALWLATDHGVMQWKTKSQSFVAVPGAPNERVFSLLVQAPDTVWVHRISALEAYRWNGQGLELIRSMGSDAGLPAVESSGLVADRSGSVWLTTSRGLWRFEPLSQGLRQFGVRDGLPSQEFSSKAPLISPSGIVIASTANGVVLFDPAKIRAENKIPRLVIEHVSIRREEDEFILPSASASVQLLPEDRDLKISARLLSFADASAHRYRFRLHGYDPDWIESGASGERIFSRLEPGMYRLEIRAANADGLWSKSRFISIAVASPWWLTTAAKLVYVFVFALALIGAATLYRWRVRRKHEWLLGQQKQQLAEHNSAAKTHFLATLGHEIRTPMTGVLGMAELLLAGDLAAKQRGQIQSIQNAGQHLLRLLNDALDLARIEAGKLLLDNAAFAVQVLLDDVGNLLRPLAEAKGLSFSLHCAPGTPQALRGDVLRVRQILLNLGNNAIKFTDTGAVVLRASALAPHGLVLEVSDSGPGMSEDQQKRLFQRFEQANGARTAARYGGSGLGLAICQELSEVMGGRIDVFSDLGQGARFVVSLPLPRAELSDVPQAPAMTAVSVVAETPSLRILLVEDDAMIAEVVTGLVQSLGHEINHAAQALSALSELASSHYDLVLCDLDLPGMDGLQLTRLLREQGHALPIIALTARSDTEAEPQARAAGMTGFLRKPVTGAMLQEVIAECLPGKGSEF